MRKSSYLSPKQVLSRLPRVQRRLARLERVVFVVEANREDLEDEAHNTADEFKLLASFTEGGQKAAIEAMADRAEALRRTFGGRHNENRDLPIADLSADDQA